MKFDDLLIVLYVYLYNMDCGALFLQCVLYTAHCTIIMHFIESQFMIIPPF